MRRGIERKEKWLAFFLRVEQKQVSINQNKYDKEEVG
jgi:hypothetical protein